MLDAEEVERRGPVWTALSELFLDTELDDANVRHIARVLSASGYDAERLEGILRREVAPAFWSNVGSVAGEWAGWAEADVRELVLAHLSRGRRPSGLLSRALGELAFRALRGDWARVRAQLRALSQGEERGR